MTFTSITALPALPADGATGDDFNDPAIAFLEALSTLRTEINTLSGEFADYLNSALTATSTTSLAIGTGSKAFTIGTGYAFTGGQFVRAASRADPSVDYMDGTVLTYTGGVLTISVGSGDNHGSGTHTDWDIGLTIDADLSVYALNGANTDITALEQDVAITENGTIAANSIGFRGLPTTAQSQGSGITLALADAGKAVPNTTGGWTIPANASIAFPVGTTIVLVNNSGSSQNVAITSDTLRLAGTATTGTRAIGQYGIATLYKVASTTWIISGAGVS
jgi:hypothetical protein